MPVAVYTVLAAVPDTTFEMGPLAIIYYIIIIIIIIMCKSVFLIFTSYDSSTDHTAARYLPLSPEVHSMDSAVSEIQGSTVMRRTTKAKPEVH